MTLQFFQYKTYAVLKGEQGCRGQAQLLEYQTSDLKRAINGLSLLKTLYSLLSAGSIQDTGGKPRNYHEIVLT